MYNPYGLGRAASYRWPHGQSCHRRNINRTRANPVGHRSTSAAGLTGPRLAISDDQEIPVSQRAVETVVGRLVTDEGFRRAFEHDPHLPLAPLLAQGISLTAAEIAALIETRATLW